MGCFTFGSGLSILLQLEEEYVDKRKLLTSENVLELTTVGKSVPGVMITNVSMLVGYQLAGAFGGILAVQGPVAFFADIGGLFVLHIGSRPLALAAANR
jgi:chromate transporter